MNDKIVKIKKPRNKADKLFAKLKFKIVLYKVTTDFGDSDAGEMREAYLINDEGDVGLLYHPSGPDGCGSFELANKNKGDKCWVSARVDAFTNYGNFGCEIKVDDILVSSAQ